MNRCGIHRGGNIHELQAKRAAGKREIADIANERDVGIVDGHVQVGLIVEAGGLIARVWARGFLFLPSVDSVAAGRRIQSGEGGEKRHDRNQSKPTKLCSIPGDFHHFLLHQNLRSLLERTGRNFLHGAGLMRGAAQGLGMRNQVSPPSLV